MAEPTFCFLIPVGRQPQEDIRATLDFCRLQRFTAWEAIVVPDGALASTRSTINHYAHIDPRIRVVESVGESNASQRRTVNALPDRPATGSDTNLQLGLARATATFCGIVDCGDLLAPRALAVLAKTLHFEGTQDVLYTDEDLYEVQNGIRHHHDVFFKPPWSPDQLLTDDYTGGLTLWRRQLMEEVGGFRSAAAGADRWDMTLRVTERTSNVLHVSEVLYHHLVGQADPRRALAAPLVLSDALARRGRRGSVQPIAKTSSYQIRRHLAVQPSVSVVMPTAGAAKEVEGRSVLLVERSVRSLLHDTDYPIAELIVVLSEGSDPELGPRLREIASHKLTLVYGRRPFSFAEAINQGSVRASGELLLLLNDDVWMPRPDWLSLLVEAISEEGVGVVGPRLLYEDGRLQHAGVQHHNGLPFHAQRFLPGDDPGYHGEVFATRNYLAVTGAVMLTRRSLFEHVGGLSSVFPMNYNDMDFCLKLGQCGWRTTYVGQSQVVHYESASRSAAVSVDDVATFLREWRTVTDPDLFLPPALVPPHAP